MKENNVDDDAHDDTMIFSSNNNNNNNNNKTHSAAEIEDSANKKDKKLPANNNTKSLQKSNNNHGEEEEKAEMKVNKMETTTTNSITGNSDGIDEMLQLPDIAITWILRNDCPSNIQLAHMSNVNRHWRRLCLEVVTLESVLWVKDGISPNVKRRFKAGKGRFQSRSNENVNENDDDDDDDDEMDNDNNININNNNEEVHHGEDGENSNIMARARQDPFVGNYAGGEGEEDEENKMDETSFASIDNDDITASQDAESAAAPGLFSPSRQGRQQKHNQQLLPDSKATTTSATSRKTPSTFTSPIRKLLLTDMARELMTRQRHQRHLQQLGVRDSIIRHSLDNYRSLDRNISGSGGTSGSSGDGNTAPRIMGTGITSSNFPGMCNNPLRRQLQQLQQQAYAANVDGNFCLGWFAPSGIQVMGVELDVGGMDGDSDEDGGDNNISNFIGSNVSGGGSVTCCYEWRGYRHAMEVLAPFGYSTEFVRSVLDAVSERDPSEALLKTPEDSVPPSTSADLPPLPSFLPSPPATNNRTLIRSSSELSQTRLSKISSYIYNPTFAVRGATLARAEGFCLCLEPDFPRYYDFDANALPLPYAFQGENAWMNNDPNRRQHPHISSVQNPSINSFIRGNRPPIQSQILIKRQNLAKVLLPRMILSTRRKQPLLHRFAETDNDGDHGQKHPSLCNPHLNVNAAAASSSFSWEKRQRSVQFLNSDRSQAVRLITTPFQCGPIRAPITMFLVGIATEDGCFVSGKDTRFEFGHLHPLCSDDMRYDTSPICIATEKEKKRERDDAFAETVPSTMKMDLLADLANAMSTSQNQNGGNNEMRSDLNGDQVNEGGQSESSSEEDDDDSSSESSGNDRTLPCHCKFLSKDPFVAGDLDIDDPSEEYVHRGGTGPGRWHCYVAIFDGKDSMIRVDGREEPQRTARYYDDVDASYSDDEDHPDRAGRFVGSGILDGLSIGSDHQFDMSLCYGDVEGQGGEGAISELAVFKGRMELSDIEQMEKYLMKKHGLLSAREQEEYIAKQNCTRMKPLRIESNLQEEEWRRKAHALIHQPPPWDLEVDPVPLRVAANHQTVSWHRTDDVTGKVLAVSRIGSKLSNGSSDW